MCLPHSEDIISSTEPMSERKKKLVHKLPITTERRCVSSMAALWVSEWIVGH